MDPDRCDLLCLDLEVAELLRADRLDEALVVRASAGAKALADPTRLTIAATLAKGRELCVCDLAWVMERAENLVSHHLRVLRDAGLVISARQGKMVFYSLSERGHALVAATLESSVPA